MGKSRQTADLVSDNNIFIDSANDRVGIGTTNPVGQLHVFSGPVIVGTSLSTGTASQRLQVTGGAYVSGNLGVGFTNPTTKLDIYNGVLGTTAGNSITLSNQFYAAGANTEYLRVKATRLTNGTDWTTTSTKLLQVVDVTEMGYIEYNPNGANYGMAFGQNATEWARFLSDGKFGIGKTNPLYKLDVVGDINFTGSLYKNGAPLTSGTSIGRVYFSTNS